MKIFQFSVPIKTKYCSVPKKTFFLNKFDTAQDSVPRGIEIIIFSTQIWYYSRLSLE